MASVKERAVEVAYGAACAGSAVVAVCLSYPRPELTALLVVLIGAVALWRWHEPMDLGVLVAGGVLGPSLEYAATTTGLWNYPHTSVGPLPAWVFTLWPFVPYTIRRLALALTPPDEDAAPRDLVLGLGAVALEIPVLCLWGNSAPVLATLLTAGLLLPVVWLSRGAHGLVLLVLMGIIGPACESIPIAVGAWSYPHPFFLGQPLWLETGYALFGFAVIRTGTGLVAAWKRREALVPSVG